MRKSSKNRELNFRLVDFIETIDDEAFDLCIICNRISQKEMWDLELEILHIRMGCASSFFSFEM